MRRIKNIFSVFVLIFTLSVHAYSAQELKVLSATPRGQSQIDDLRQISISFNQPVVALSEENAFSSDNCPLHITPSMPGKCRFSGTQTLEFEPQEPWQPSTRYEVTLSGDFASEVSKQQLAEPYTFSFTTRQPRVLAVSPYDNEQWIDLKPLIYVTISQKIKLSSVKEGVTLSYQQESMPQQSRWQKLRAYLLDEPVVPIKEKILLDYDVRFITEKEHKEKFSYYEPEQVLVFTPTHPLPKGTRITLNIGKKVQPQVGVLGMENEYTSSFMTYPELQIMGGEFTGCLPYNAQIRFSTPVRLKDLLKHVKLDPADALLDITPQEAESLGQQKRGTDQEKGYFAMPLSFVRINPKESVSVTIDANLTDIYGQRLGQEKLLIFSNTGYCPDITYNGGTGVVESYLPLRHPIELLNVSKLPVRAARFSKEDFIDFYKKDIGYCRKAEIAAANLQYDADYSFDVSEDKLKITYLDLKKFNPSGQNSIIFSQVRVPSSYRSEGYCWISATDNITDLGVTMKTSQDNIVLWVTSLQTAEPQGNLSVELRDIDNKTLWTGSTDQNGLVFAPGLKELNAKRKNPWSAAVVFAFITSPGGDAVLASSWNKGLEPWRFNLRYDDVENAALKSVLFTERGVYRPGEKVYFKGFTRQKSDGLWQMPKLEKGTLQVLDSRWEEILKQEVNYDVATGSFSGEITLPATAVTGTWRLTFTPQGKDEGLASEEFQVQSLKAAEFAVNLTPLKKQYVGGEKAEFVGTAQYLFGSPAAEAKAKWSVQGTTDSFHPENYEEYDFTPYFLRSQNNKKLGLLLESSGVLNEKGEIKFSVDLPQVSTLQEIYTDFSVQAPTGQQLFTRDYVYLHPADFYIGVKQQTGPVEAGEAVRAHVVAVDINGKPLSDIKVKALVEKEEYFSVRKNGLAGRLEWVSEEKIKQVHHQNFTLTKDGYDLSFNVAEAGYYRVLLESQDAQGRIVKSGFTFSAYGKGEAYWKQSDDDILMLQADKEKYQSGDTARILVKSPYENALALVSVEREGVLDAWTAPVSAGADYVEVPIKANYFPNVYVSVSLVRGRSQQDSFDKEGLDLGKPQGKTGYVSLMLDSQEHQIQTTLTTPKKEYKPGQEVKVKIHTSLSGQSIPADVAIMVVDEGVLALTDYELPDLQSRFYPTLPLGVSTADNRVFLIGQRNFGEKGENRGGGGGADAKLGGTDLRSHFTFTPYFKANVQTDAKGKAEVKFTLPDNLTDFRIMAVAATAQDFGTAQTNIKVAKPLMILPKMPRFARIDDKFECGAVVYNYQNKAASLKVSAQASNGVKLTPKTHQITLKKGASAQLSWPCEALYESEAEVSFAVSGGKESDGVKITLPVREVEKKQTLALYGATENSQEQLIKKPTSVNKKAGAEVGVSLASTALLNLRGGMLYLLVYPYDCLEQRMSKILPIVEGARLVQDFNLGDISQYKQKAQSILDEMPKYQDFSGGYAYWPDQKADFYVTAYALEGAYRAQKAGFKVPEKSLKKAVAWLKNVFAKDQRGAFAYSVTESKSMRAYAVYVLSLYGEKMNGQFNNLYAEQNSLSTTAKAYLLMAASAMNQEESVKENLAQSLLNQAVYGAQSMHFSASVRQPWLHISDVKLTALCLEALLKSGRNFEQSYQAVKWLTDQLSAQGHWENTNTNAAVFSALNAYYLIKESAEPDFKAQIFFDKTNKMNTSFKGRSLQSQNADWSFDDIYAAHDQVRVKVSKSGQGTLFYTISQTYAPQSYAQAVSAGFELRREITDLKGNPVKHFVAGERYKVTLHVKTPDSRSFVVVEDFVPAGFEIINTAFATESRQLEQEEQQSADWVFDYSQIYDDRMAVFANYMPSGEYSYSYFVQTNLPGKYSYPSLWASAMYDPAVFGRNATQEIEIKN